MEKLSSEKTTIHIGDPYKFYVRKIAETLVEVVYEVFEEEYGKRHHKGGKQ